MLPSCIFTIVPAGIKAPTLDVFVIVRQSSLTPDIVELLKEPIAGHEI